MNVLKKLFPAVCAAALALSLLSFGAAAEDGEPDLHINGKVLEYDEKHAYDIASYYCLDKTSELETLGQLSVTGNMIGSSTENIPALEVDESGGLTFTYTYCNALFNDDKFNWHITDDTCSEVDGVKLGGKIGTGAIVIETSYDRENWTVAEKYLDILRIPEGAFDSRSYTADCNQLTEGCYFRVIVAYKLEIQLDDTKFWFIDTSDKDRKRVAEVYEFYAVSQSSDEVSVIANENKLPVGTLYAAGDNSGYSGSREVGTKDPHYGWKMGSFYLSGYSEVKDGDVLIKNGNEAVSLWFNLSQFDLNKLHGDKDLSIKPDTNGSDSYFGISGADFRRGALIVRRTDQNGIVGEPQVTADFLGSAETPFKDMLVQYFDEGDYEVALDYRINEDGFLFFSDQYDYRIFFTFKVRNSGCTLALPDNGTGEDLEDASSTICGFKISSPSSEYLKFKVSLSRWTEKENGYTETHIYDRAASADEVFDEEGIYTVTAVNPATDPQGEEPFIRRIYVGADEVIRAYVSGKNPDMTVNMIADCLAEGGTVAEDGTVIPPPEPEEDSSSEAEAPRFIIPAEFSEADTKTEAVPEGTAYDSPGPSFPIIPLLCAAVTAGAAVFFLYVGRHRDDE